MDGSIPSKKAAADTSTWRPQTRAVRGGHVRSNFDETSEALFLTSGYAYVTLWPLEEFELTTAAIFDLGVFLSVLGAVLLTLASLSRLALRQGERANTRAYDSEGDR